MMFTVQSFFIVKFRGKLYGKNRIPKVPKGPLVLIFYNFKNLSGS